MGSTTRIEWTDATWNPVTGCSKVSPGCKNCYAERVFPRAYSGRKFTDVQCHPERLEQPLHWKKSRKVFVNSMSDLFHEQVPDEFIDDVFGIMALTPHVTYQILTKRPVRMESWFTGLAGLETRESAVQRAAEHRGKIIWDARGNTTYLYHCATAKAVENRRRWCGWPLPNVHLGVSVENQETKSRIDILRNVPAAVRFLSLEPLLEDLGELDLQGIHWVIVGGESGPHARPMHPDWVRSIRDQCVAAGVPFFFKQWGEWQSRWYTDGDLPSRLGTDATWEDLEKHPEKYHVWDHMRVAPPGDAEYESALLAERVGKKTAGALLDGREWKEFPDTTRVTRKERHNANPTAETL